MCAIKGLIYMCAMLQAKIKSTPKCSTYGKYKGDRTLWLACVCQHNSLLSDLSRAAGTGQTQVYCAHTINVLINIQPVSLNYLMERGVFLFKRNISFSPNLIAVYILNMMHILKVLQQSFRSSMVIDAFKVTYYFLNIVYTIGIMADNRSQCHVMS